MASLLGEILIEGLPGDADAFGEVFHRQGVVAVFRDQGERRLENGFVAVLPLALTQADFIGRECRLRNCKGAGECSNH